MEAARLQLQVKRWGYRKAWAIPRDEGWDANRKTIQRLWRKEGLKVPQRIGSRYSGVFEAPLVVVAAGGNRVVPARGPAARRSAARAALEKTA